MSVYAPSTNVGISGNSPLFGAVLGKTLEASGGTAIHYDTQLVDGLGELLQPVDRHAMGAPASAGALVFGGRRDRTESGLVRLTMLAALAALALSQSASAALTVCKNATAPGLRVDAGGNAEVSWTAGGRRHDARASRRRACSRAAPCPAATSAGRCAASRSRSSAGEVRPRRLVLRPAGVADGRGRAGRAALLALARRPDGDQPHREEGETGVSSPGARRSTRSRCRRRRSAVRVPRLADPRQPGARRSRRLTVVRVVRGGTCRRRTSASRIA